MYHFPFRMTCFHIMFESGTYIAKVQFIDDDKVVHLEFSYAFKIAKDWDDGKQVASKSTK